MKNVAVEALLRENEVSFEYRQKYPISKIRRDPHDESQVRHGNNNAPSKEVQQYAAQLRAGADFPAVLIRKSDGLLYEGNTRYESHKVAGREVIEVYLTDVLSPKVMKRLSVAINNLNGKRCSRREVTDYLDSQNGQLDAEQFIRDTGWSKTSLAKFQALKEVDHRLQAAGINRSDKTKPRRKVDDGVQVHANSIRQTEPFLAFYRLAEDSGLKAGEAKVLAVAIHNASSETEMLSLIDAERERRHSQIQEIKAGFNPGSSTVGLTRLHCGWIVKQGPARLEDWNLATRGETREWLEKAHRVLTSALSRYEDLDSE